MTLYRSLAGLHKVGGIRRLFISERPSKRASAKPAASGKVSKWRSETDARLKEAERLMHSKDWVGSVAAWEQVLKQYKLQADIPASHVERYSKALRFSGNAQIAVEQSRSYLAERGRHPSLVREHAENLAAIGDAIGAMQCWEEFISLRGNNTPPFAYNRLARLKASEGMLQDALKVIDAGLLLHPDAEMLHRAQRQINLDYGLHQKPKNAAITDFASHLFTDFRESPGRGVVAVTVRDEPANKYVAEMLDFERYYAPVQKGDPLEDCDAFFVWGSTQSTMHDLCRDYSERNHKPLFTIEYGLVSSLNIAANGSIQHSLIICPGPIYYDSTQPTAPETDLNSNTELTEVQLRRARRCISKLVETRATKYNHAPIVDLSNHFPKTSRPKILLVDQRLGDKSVALGLASAETFRRMFERALAMDDHDIVVKLHPDAISGNFGSYLGELAAEFASERVQLIDYDVNPYSLFDVVDKVFVATSQFGLEAVFAGKEVYCFGAPFYAGWGFTHDMSPVPRRQRTRLVEEVFHTFYIKYSRYHVPGGRSHELEELIDYICMHRGNHEGVVGLDVSNLAQPRIVIVVPSGRMGASGRYIQSLAEALMRRGCEILVLSEGKTPSSVNGVRWATIDFDGAVMSSSLRQKVIKFEPDVVLLNGVRTRAQRIALEVMALTGAKLINQNEDDDRDIFEHRYPKRSVEHLTKLDKVTIDLEDFTTYLSQNDWSHTLRVLSNPDHDRWIEPILRMLTTRLAIGNAAIWYPYAKRLGAEFGKPTVIVPPVASRFDFERTSATPAERAEILTRYGISASNLVFFVGGSVYPYSNDLQIFLRAMNQLYKQTGSGLALVVAGKSAIDVEELIHETLHPEIQRVTIIQPSDAVFLELTRACDVCCNPGLDSGFNEYRLPSRLVRPMAMGKPVLTGRNGFGESLTHGFDALVTVGNDPESWAERMRIALDPERLQSIGRHGRRFAIEHFDPDKVAARLQVFLGKCLSEAAWSNPRPLGVSLAADVSPLVFDPSPIAVGLEALALMGLRDIDAACHIGPAARIQVSDYIRLGAQRLVVVDAAPDALPFWHDFAGREERIVAIGAAAVERYGEQTSVLQREAGGNTDVIDRFSQPDQALFDAVDIKGKLSSLQSTNYILDAIPRLGAVKDALLVIEGQNCKELLNAVQLELQNRIGWICISTTHSSVSSEAIDASGLIDVLRLNGYDASMVKNPSNDSVRFVVGRRLS